MQAPGGPRLGVPDACGRLTSWQALWEFPSSLPWGLSLLPLKASAAFKHFVGERKGVSGAVGRFQSGELKDSNLNSCVFDLEYYCSEKFAWESYCFLIIC